VTITGPPPTAPDIIDAHAHLLNTSDLTYAWIANPSPKLTRLLPNYYDIARDFGPADYESAVGDTAIAAVIACEFGASDPRAEVDWIQRCHDDTGCPAAFIAAIDLSSPDRADHLARYRDQPVVRAVRQPLYWSDDPLTRLGARPDFLTDPAWRRGFELVAGSGFVWDLLVYSEQLPAAESVVRDFPEVPIVLEATGWPLDQSAAGFAKWRDALASISRYRNVTLKLQGLPLVFGPGAALTPWLRTAVDIFGADRCLFATHLPVDALLWSPAELIASVHADLGHLGLPDLAELFGGTARRVYLANSA
jgi:predicted TIM-barrel fold metal-dependent hydrolase